MQKNEDDILQIDISIILLPKKLKHRWIHSRGINIKILGLVKWYYHDLTRRSWAVTQISETKSYILHVDSSIPFNSNCDFQTGDHHHRHHSITTTNETDTNRHLYKQVQLRQLFFYNGKLRRYITSLGSWYEACDCSGAEYLQFNYRHKAMFRLYFCYNQNQPTPSSSFVNATSRHAHGPSYHQNHWGNVATNSAYAIFLLILPALHANW